MSKQIIALGIFLGATQAYAEAKSTWWIVSVNNEPAICGQTIEGQLLCLNGEPALPRARPLQKARGLAEDWSFLRPGPGPI